MMGGRRLVKRLLYLINMELGIQDAENMLLHHAGQTTDPGLGRCSLRPQPNTAETFLAPSTYLLNKLWRHHNNLLFCRLGF